MTGTGLRSLLSKFRRRETADSIFVQPLNLAGKGQRHSFATSFQCIAFGLIVMGGIGKGCCPSCPPPKFDTPVFSPTSLTFPPQVVNPAGSAGASQIITLTAKGTANALAISSITVSADYSQTNDCPASLATGSSCTIQVTFAPNAIGPIQGLLMLNGNNAVSFSGSGILPVSFSPVSLDFGSVDPGTTSTPQTVTVTNNQATALAINGISTSGNYSQTNNCPASLPASTTCAIQVSFAPTVSGAIPGVLALVTNADPSGAAVDLTGIGSGSVTANLSFSPAAVAFADQEAGTTSATQPVTLTNTSGVSSLTINSVSSSTPNYIENDTCSGQVLSPGATCTINVSFAPIANLAPLTYAGAITVSDSDGTSPNVFGLSGTGVAPVTTSPPNVDLGTVFYSAEPTQTVTITNNHNGTEDITLNSPSAFSVNSSCPGSLPAGGQCNVDLQFLGGKGPIKETLEISDSSGGFLNPHITNLSACGTEIQSMPSSFNFGSVPVGNPSDPQTLTINNGNTLKLVNVTGISVAGPNAGDFSIVSNTCSSSLAAGQSCVLKTVFTPQNSGTRTAILNISDDADCSPQQLALLGGSAAGPFTITASAIGTAGGNVTSDLVGINCGDSGASCSASYASGSIVTLTATPDAGTVFAGWVGACSGTGACMLNMTADKQVRAVFGSNPLLNVTLTPLDNGAGTVTSRPVGINCGTACSQEFAPETPVTLAPHPASGSTFAGWGDGCSGVGTCTVTMLSSVAVEAQFGAPAFSVAATAPNPATISPGQSATATVTVSSVFGFDKTVSFSCTVQPPAISGPTCSMGSITPPANGSATGTLTVKTQAPTVALLHVDRRSHVLYAGWLVLFGCLATAFAGGSRRRSLTVLLLLFNLLLGGVLFGTSCGGGTVKTTGSGSNPGTPAGSYTISINGSSGSVLGTTQIMLTVE
jgi:hypothetical protein